MSSGYGKLHPENYSVSQFPVRVPEMMTEVVKEVKDLTDAEVARIIRNKFVCWENPKPDPPVWNMIFSIFAPKIHRIHPHI